jgi:cob(I)alamin adenosyltransferase
MGDGMKIYTRTGDRGETSLLGGRRARKSSQRVEAYGTVDELNAFLGLALAYSGSGLGGIGPQDSVGQEQNDLGSAIAAVQKELFLLGADLAQPSVAGSPDVAGSPAAASGSNAAESPAEASSADESGPSGSSDPATSGATAHAATTPGASGAAQSAERRITAGHVRRLESLIDQFQQEVQPLHSFIMPGGSPLSAYLHVARTVARRAERQAVALSETDEVNPQAIAYLNRLSDLLFVMARVANRRAGVAE